MDRASTLPSDHRVTAVLGPTNTGKTHLAIERMLGHSSGVIGLPLRLLAREVYDQIRAIKGSERVALMTGEERIIPAQPQWFVSTVEAMPTDRHFALVAIDEAQLAADPERGHIFTERILHARGFHETLILGSESLKPVLNSLLPKLEIITRPRVSELRYCPPCKIEKLPRRSAIVAFSAAEVYRLADEVRRIHGGCAVIMGNLSPRTRNAQVELFQSGEVDYLVATDAIGLGLNLSLAHVAFASLRKFDGKHLRYLQLAELAQIAGRAGRHQNSGSFSTLTLNQQPNGERGSYDPSQYQLPAATIKAIEDHRFPPLKTLFWRHDELDYSSIPRLLQSLERLPPDGQRVLRRKSDADDHLVLQQVSADEAITRQIGDSDGVKLLWSVCQIPDYGKNRGGTSHRRLVETIFAQLAGVRGKIPAEWLHQNLQKLDEPSGGIEQLSDRLAQIRTMAYVAHRPDWLTSPGEFQILAAVIEERLSDALHQSLTQLFVDRRATVMRRKLGSTTELVATLDSESQVWIDGHAVGRLEGLGFIPAHSSDPEQQRIMARIARRALAPEITARVTALLKAPLHRFRLNPDGQLIYRLEGQQIRLATLIRSTTPLQPTVELARLDLMASELVPRLQARAGEIVTEMIERDLSAVIVLRDDRLPDELSAAARGLAYCLYENLGWIECDRAAVQLKSLTKRDRQGLTRLGVRFGHSYCFVAGLFNPAGQKLLGVLLKAARGGEDSQQRLRGMVAIGDQWVRLDRFEQLGFHLRQAAKKGEQPTVPQKLRQELQIASVSWEPFLRSLQQRVESSKRQKKREKPRESINIHSPFRVLAGRS
ncbi:MAG: helicase-related protein [Alphaproteobacteria bacterium]|nr:helicase-related protein [Alphaproteobacteria bacterium]